MLELAYNAGITVKMCKYWVLVYMAKGVCIYVKYMW